MVVSAEDFVDGVVQKFEHVFQGVDLKEYVELAEEVGSMLQFELDAIADAARRDLEEE